VRPVPLVSEAEKASGFLLSKARLDGAADILHAGHISGSFLCRCPLRFGSHAPFEMGPTGRKMNCHTGDGAATNSSVYLQFQSASFEMRVFMRPRQLGDFACALAAFSF
jgi:hypothetical protein